MKHRSLKLVMILAVTLFTSTAFADNVFIYNGYRGHADGHRAYGPRSADRHDYRPREWHGSRYRDAHHFHGPRSYKSKQVYRDYQPWHHYGPDHGRYRPGYNHAHHRGGYRPRYNHDHHHGYRSYPPILAGGRIGSVIGAEFGGRDPAAFGGASLGASIGREGAHQRRYRHR